jgi:WD40 repeat protein
LYSHFVVGCLGADHQAMLWDIAEGRLIKDLLGHGGDVHTVCFSREGEVLASGMLFFVCFCVCPCLCIGGVCVNFVIND